MRTTDGGETWENLDTGYSGALFNCTFPSENVGYACGFSQTIIKTSDGGDTWEVQNSGSNTLNYIEFSNELNGWAGGDFGAFYSTTNGGLTWNSSTPFGGAALWSGHYVSDDAAFVMGRGIIIKSENGGASWELLKNGPPNSSYRGLYFFSDEVGYAAGAAGAPGEGSDRAGIVYTQDGGQTWEQQYLGFTGGWSDVHFSDSNNGTVIGGGNFAKTTNGGDDWVQSSPPFDITGRCSWFFNASEGVIGGQGVFSSVCKTEDGGSSYTCQDNTLATDFYFTSDLNGWAVGEASSEFILHTVDGADTWNYIPTGNNQTKHSVFFLDEDHGWVGTNGSVLRTEDGGSTWESSNVGAINVGVHFYTEHLGFCLDHQGNIWRSEDTGESWDLFLSGDDPTMKTIEEAYFTANNVYAGAWGGDIYKATLGCADISTAQIFSTNEWCPGEENTIGFSSTTPVVDFEWTFPEGWSAEINFNTVDLTAGNNSGEIELVTFNACGLSTSSQLTVVVTPLVEEISSLQYPTNLCSNEPFEIQIQDVQNGVEYEWTIPNDWISEIAGSSVNILS
ncbi:MAG: YCF48-related protein, partial [Bacteroidota bacterium]